MKIHILIALLCLLSLTSCKEKIQKIVSSNISTSELPSAQVRSLEFIFNYADSMNLATRSSTTFFQEISQLKNNAIAHVPLYNLDIETFYKSPTPETFLSSLYLPTDLDVFIAKEENGTYTAFWRKKYGEHWYLGLCNEVEKDYEWLLPPFKEKESTDFHVIRVASYTYYSYLSQGQRIYRDSMGRTLTSEELCQYLFEFIQTWKEHAERGDTLFI